MSNTNLLSLAALVFTAVTCVVIGDTAGKLLTSNGVDPLIVAWSRFVLAAIFLLPFSGLSRSEFGHFTDWRVLVRACFIAAGICCILTALRTEPIANVFGAFFIGPVVSYILAILFLGEKPSRSRGLLLAFGFVGVMFVVKPGFGVSSGMLLALAAGICYGTYLAMTRAVAGSYRPRFLLISQLLVGSVLLNAAWLVCRDAPFGDICPGIDFTERLWFSLGKLSAGDLKPAGGSQPHFTFGLQPVDFSHSAGRVGFRRLARRADFHRPAYDHALWRRFSGYVSKKPEKHRRTSHAGGGLMSLSFPKFMID